MSETKETNERFLNILIGGEAGQGLQTVGPILAKTLMRAGYSIHVTQTYESRVRGGHNTFAIRTGIKKVLAPQEPIDILIALSEETVGPHQEHLTEKGYIIGNEEWEIDHDRWIGVPFKMFGKEIYWNTSAIALAAGLIGLKEDLLGHCIREFFGPDRAGENLRVMEGSYRWLEGQPFKMDQLPAVSDPPKRLMLNGHESVALGAISAGLKFCAFYPMSPSTSIPQNLIEWARPMGLVIEQAEDEIAAINMAIGASFAGVPSMVATSGGGFALMTESVSLAGVSETPVVVVIGQRPGPATGLATRTEQGDLWFILHSGHGEFPRAVFAPGTIEECFHLTRKAFVLAEKYQGPIFVLTDHFLADSHRDLAPIDMESLPFVKPGAEVSDIQTPYCRYRITEDGISPRLLPGLTKNLVVVDSHEHREDGHLTEDLSLRPKMVDKRMRKGEGLRSEVVTPDFQGDEVPELLLVCWGSSKGAVEEAASMLRSNGKTTATLHFSQLWPIVPEQFQGRLEQAKAVLTVESNATAQLARLIRRETGFLIERHVLRYDGLPITPEYILRGLNAQI